MTIIQVADIRAEGLTVDDITDARIDILSVGWQQWLEDMCGVWFESQSLDMNLDGDGSRVLHLPIPIISLTALYINESTTALSSSYYTVYNRYAPYDDRKNPRIKLKRSNSTNIFVGASSSKFAVGDLNQRVVGDFGYVESDGSAPYLVQRAITQLIIATAELIGDSDIDQLKIGKAIEEVTDRHRIRYSDLWDELNSYMPTGLTEVDQTIRMYKRPIHIAMARSSYSSV
jgi:hypothetical protein